jgi:hypothetical protein
MRLTSPFLAVALHFALLVHYLAAAEAMQLDVMQTAEHLRKPLGEMNFPEATLEKRITALRSIADPLGIRVTTSKGVEAAAKRWTCPAIIVKEANMIKVLQYTSDITRLMFLVRPGEVHLLLASEMPQKEGTKPDSNDEHDPLK